MEDVLRILAYFVLELTSRTLTSLCTLEIPEFQCSEFERPGGHREIQRLLGSSIWP